MDFTLRPQQAQGREDTLALSLPLAPLETEMLTPETVASLNAARMSLSRGEGISHDQILREFNLTTHRPNVLR